MFSTLVLVMALVTGCSTGGGSEKPAASSAPKPQETKVLRVWDANASGAMHDLMVEVAKEFEASHPGVKVEYTGHNFDEYVRTVQRAATTGDAPDVLAINQGESNMGPMVRAGRLLSLEGYAKQYGWTEKIPTSLLNRNRYTTDGKTLGKGELWGISMNGELVGFYYNKELFAAAGVQVPKSFAELEQVMDKLKAKGITPIIFGNLDKWAGIHMYSEVLAPFISPDYMDGLIYGHGQLSWETPEVKEAAARLQQWVQKGYFMEKFEGVSYDDAWKLFANEKGAMFSTGSWLAPELAPIMGENLGFFLVPVGPSGKEPVHVGGMGVAMGIMKGSKQPDLAAEFLNLLLADSTVSKLLKINNLPAGKVPAAMIPKSGVASDLYTAWNRMLDANSVGHYIDWATPTFFDTTTSQIQELMGLRITPEKFASELQKDYAAFRAPK